MAEPQHPEPEGSAGEERGKLIDQRHFVKITAPLPLPLISDPQSSSDMQIKLLPSPTPLSGLHEWTIFRPLDRQDDQWMILFLAAKL